MRCVDNQAGTHVLTEGGLVRTLKVGRSEHTMHLWWSGDFVPTSGDSQGRAAQEKPAELLVEIELLKVVGDSAVVRFWAPEQVSILSAKIDPHCQAASPS